MELFAFAAALSWATANLFASAPARHLGGFHFSRLRMTLMGVAMLPIVWFSASLPDIEPWVALVVLSAFVGIVLGDVSMFACLARLGPRRTGVLFATNAPLTAALNVVIFDISYGVAVILGAAMVSVGVVIAIWFGRKPTGAFNPDEATTGTLLIGVSLGLLAALGQASGALLIKPVVDAGIDPWLISALRVAASAIMMQCVYALFRGAFPMTAQPMNSRLWLGMAMSGLLGMTLGMSFLLVAFSKGDVGVASILSATTPVVILPLLWLKNRERPALMAWVGAALCVLGSALIIG